jgi:hypothetical protein
MIAFRVLIFTHLFALHGFLSCQARPVSTKQLQKKTPQSSKNWLTLASGGTSSNEAKERVKSHITTAVDQSQPEPTTLSPHSPADRAFEALAARQKGLNWTGLSEQSRRSHKAQASGQYKKLHRKKWQQKYDDISPPIGLMTQKELFRIGLTPQGLRHHVTRYLEANKLRKGGFKWPKENEVIEKLSVYHRYLPLIRTDKPLSDSRLVKKQAELDKLLDDDGLLTTSYPDKKAASTLYVNRYRHKWFTNGEHPGQASTDDA